MPIISTPTRRRHKWPNSFWVGDQSTNSPTFCHEAIFWWVLTYYIYRCICILIYHKMWITFYWSFYRTCDRYWIYTDTRPTRSVYSNIVHTWNAILCKCSCGVCDTKEGYVEFEQFWWPIISMVVPEGKARDVRQWLTTVLAWRKASRIGENLYVCIVRWK